MPVLGGLVERGRAFGPDTIADKAALGTSGDPVRLLAGVVDRIQFGDRAELPLELPDLLGQRR